MNMPINGQLIVSKTHNKDKRINEEINVINIADLKANLYDFFNRMATIKQIYSLHL
ncbi:hypothetical protein FB2170_07799 [Maribacter sp. HTCC2170]|nr:hypothetical protein FB2170_07799 [Maribacter sp. HTCC2170]